jgi:hypothetical protein
MMVLGHPHHLAGQFRRQPNLSLWWLAADLEIFSVFVFQQQHSE